MLQKIIYSLLGIGMWSVTSGIAHADTVCKINGQVVQCPTWLPAFSGTFILVWGLIAILMVVSLWKIFTKAGKPGWASIVPVYNTIVQLEIANRPMWWIILFFIPIVNIIVAFIVLVNFAKAYGKGIGFTLGLIFLPIIFFPILAFGKAQYIGINRNDQMNPPTVPPSTI